MSDPFTPQPGVRSNEEQDVSRRREAVSAYVDRVEGAWLAAGLPSRERRRLASELEDNLQAALDAGATPHDICDLDPADLAREITAAEGIESRGRLAREPVNRGGLVRWGVGSAIAMAGAIWFFLLMPLAALFFDDETRTSLIVSVGVLYGTCAALTIGAAAAGMAHYLRGIDRAAATVRLATVAFAVAGAVGVALCIGLARLARYSSAPLVVLTYVLVVGGLTSAAIALAWQQRPPSADARRTHDRVGPVPRTT